ncbi:MAG: DUF1844 domain-containing protein [Pirellula sp.]|nr:DUF1844 domain-containing protein [Pirellula sp.]
MSAEKKIIIDEDWKSQVAAEKEAALRQPEGDEADAEAIGELPEASFELLISTFVTEAMVALGQFPHPGTGEIEADAGHAKFAIDMIEVIVEKTKGNLDPMEEQGIKDILHQLRMAFIAVTQGPK